MKCVNHDIFNCSFENVETPKMGPHIRPWALMQIRAHGLLSEGGGGQE